MDLGNDFLPHFRKVFNYYLLKYFLMVLLFVFFFWDSYDSNVWAFHIVPEISEVVLISLILFSFFLSASFISTIISSTSLILSIACYSTVVSLQSVFDLIYCIIHYILTCSFLLGPC